MQKMLIETGVMQLGEVCKCCRKRYAVDGVRCNTCILKGNGVTKDRTIREIFEQLDHDNVILWMAALEGRQSGLRQRAKHAGRKFASRLDMAKKLEQQKMRCFFTGRRLFPDAELRLAHLVSAANGGTFEIENLVWTTHEINKMMGSMNYKEFYSIASAVVLQENLRIIEGM